jgi:hypothetical protein
MADNPTPDADLPADETAPDPDAELIAYLDGELDGPEAREVEARLSRDPAARTRADVYKKTFDLLDYLPRTEPSPDFATRTLTRLQPTASGERRAARTDDWPAARRWPLVSWLAAGVLAVVGGFGLHAALRPFLDRSARAEELSNADVRVIENLPLYLGVDDLDFLRALDDPELFAPDPGGVPVRGENLRLDVPPANRQKLESMYAAYSPARRQQLRELDQHLRELPEKERNRLVRVLEGYAVWLDRLTDPDRREVLAAPAADVRQDTVRRVKERMWRDSLPAKAREQLKLVATEQERLGLVEDRKTAERVRREEWQLARRQWEDLQPDRKPWPFSDPELARGVDEYVKTVLHVHLPSRPEGKADLSMTGRVTPAEYGDLWARRRAAVNGGGGWDWFGYGLLVHRLSERHPYLPPFGDRKPLTDVSDLPIPLVRELRVKGGLQVGEKRSARGKWPEFALDVDAAARRAKVRLKDRLGPARPGEFSPEVNAFVEGLVPKLAPAERERLAKLEGKWPEYPRALLDLAARHDLPIPGVTLPGEPSRWARFYSLAPRKE